MKRQRQASRISPLFQYLGSIVKASAHSRVEILASNYSSMNLQLKKFAGGAVTAAMLLGGASVAFAQTYDNGQTGAMNSGTIVPSSTNSVGVTGNTSNTTSGTSGTVQSTSASGTTSGTGSTGTSGTVTTGTTGSSATTNTSGTGTTDTGPATPGIPNTGAGGDATTMLAILFASAVVGVGGALYLTRQKFAF